MEMRDQARLMEAGRLKIKNLTETFSPMHSMFNGKWFECLTVK